MPNPKRTLKLEVFSGFHDPDLDSCFLATFLSAWAQTNLTDTLNLEVDLYGIGNCSQPSVKHRTNAENTEQKSVGYYQAQPIIVLGFSAGCIRAAFSARLHHDQKRHVLGLIAVDGWGLPLTHSRIPAYRMSHDLFTHTSSLLLGGQGLFFADPPVSHLAFWQHFGQVKGWYCLHPKVAMEMNASQALILRIMDLVAPHTNAA